MASSPDAPVLPLSDPPRVAQLRDVAEMLLRDVEHERAFLDTIRGHPSRTDLLRSLEALETKARTLAAGLRRLERGQR